MYNHHKFRHNKINKLVATKLKIIKKKHQILNKSVKLDHIILIY